VFHLKTDLSFPDLRENISFSSNAEQNMTVEYCKRPLNCQSILYPSGGVFSCVIIGLPGCTRKWTNCAG
jgi:hypothetical protein